MRLVTFSNFEKIANTFTVTDIADSNCLFYHNVDDVVDEFDFVSKGKGNFPYDNYGIFLIKENDEIVGIYSHRTGDNKFVLDEEGGVLNKWGDYPLNYSLAVIHL